jgi:VanZ family protein
LPKNTTFGKPNKQPGLVPNSVASPGVALVLSTCVAHASFFPLLASRHRLDGPHLLCLWRQKVRTEQFSAHHPHPRVQQIVFGVRKVAHVTEYAVLSWLVARALLRPGTPWGRWRRNAALLAWLIASLYAASDEIHQAFVPNRQARWGDVGLDSLGAALGVMALYRFGRWRHYW